MPESSTNINIPFLHHISSNNNEEAPFQTDAMHIDVGLDSMNITSPIQRGSAALPTTIRQTKTEKRGTCRNWKAGRCRRGDKCFFLHENEVSCYIFIVGFQGIDTYIV